MKVRPPARSRLAAALVETAEDMHAAGLMDAAGLKKITRRHLSDAPANVAPMTGDDIRALRATARMSQTVFAHYLNVTAGYVSQLERGAKHPTGPALALLDIIRRKGMAAIQ